MSSRDEVQPLSDTEKLFLEVCKEGNIQRLQEVFNIGVDVNVNDGYNSALHVVVSRGDVEMMKMLLGNPQIDLNCCNKSQQTILHLAAKGGFTDLMELILSDSRFIEVNSVDSSTMNALHCAAEMGHFEAAKLLLSNDKFLELNAKDWNDSTALHHAAAKGHIDIVKLLLDDERFTEINAKDKGYRTAFHKAVAKGDKLVVSLFFQDKRFNEFNSKDKRKCNVLHYAANSGNAEVASLLLRDVRFTEYNGIEEFGWSPLHYAAYKGHIEVVKVLLQDERINLHPKNVVDGFSPLHLAIKRNQSEIIELITRGFVSRQGGDEKLAQKMVELCIKYGNNFSNGLGFHAWLVDVVRFAIEIPFMDWQKVISYVKLNPFVAVCDEINSSIPGIHAALKILRCAFQEPKQSQVFHIHLVGDGKAGKSVASKWLIDLFAKAKYQKDDAKSSYDRDYRVDKYVKHFTNVKTGRTRGVKTTTLRFHDKKYDQSNHLLPSNEYMIMIHDYGGQEEFLTNHANFLATNNSIYLIMIPLLEIGYNIKQRRMRSITEMLERYLFWCRFIFSVVRRDQAFPQIIDHNSSSNDRGDSSDKKVAIQQTTNVVNGGIPLISIINEFKKYCYHEMYANHIQNAIPVLERQLRNEFHITTNSPSSSSQQTDDCDFYVPLLKNQWTGSRFDDSIFKVIDNASNSDMLEVIRIMETMMDNNSMISGQHRKTMIIDHIVAKFDEANLSIFMTEEQWQHWMKAQVLNYPFTPPLSSLMTMKDIDSKDKQEDAETKKTLLSDEQFDDLIQLLSNYCEESLLTMNKIMILSEAVGVNGYKIVTNPSVLSTEILGDLLWWFHKYNVNKMDIENLRLSQQSIIDKLTIVDKERKKVLKTETDEERLQLLTRPLSIGMKVSANYKGKGKFLSGIIDRINRDNTATISYKNGHRERNVARDMIRPKVAVDDDDDDEDEEEEEEDEYDGDSADDLDRNAEDKTHHDEKKKKKEREPPIVTAMDYLSKLEGGVDSLPLVELLNKMGLGVQIYDEKKKEMQSWMLGLAPDFPKGRKELRFDWWPDHEIRRYFRLPDTRACFIPGYFLRLFVNMVNNKGYELIEGYGNAAKMSKTFRYPPGIAKCEVQILLCQLSDKDQDAFIVSVAGKGEQAMKNAFRELNIFRGFIYGDSWGLNFQEFCLPLCHVHDQKRLSRVREDFIDEKKGLDEVVPYIFGIPQCAEKDEVVATIVKTKTEEVHEDCMAVRNKWREWFLGGRPDIVKAKVLSKEEQEAQGLLLLRKGAQHKPTTAELANGKYTSKVLREQEEEALLTAMQSGEQEEMLRLELSDIFQRYGESCYDKELKKVVKEACGSVETLIESLVDSDSLLDCYNEVNMRETLYRCLKLFYHNTVSNSVLTEKEKNAKNIDSFVSLRMFDDCIDRWKTKKLSTYVQEERMVMNEVDRHMILSEGALSFDKLNLLWK